MLALGSPPPRVAAAWPSAARPARARCRARTRRGRCPRLSRCRRSLRLPSASPPGGRPALRRTDPLPTRCRPSRGRVAARPPCLASMAMSMPPCSGPLVQALGLRLRDVRGLERRDALRLAPRPSARVSRPTRLRSLLATTTASYTRACLACRSASVVTRRNSTPARSPPTRGPPSRRSSSPPPPPRPPPREAPRNPRALRVRRRRPRRELRAWRLARSSATAALVVCARRSSKLHGRLLGAVAQSARSSTSAGTVSSSASGADRCAAASRRRRPPRRPRVEGGSPRGGARASPGRSCATSASIAAESRHTDRMNAAAREKAARAPWWWRRPRRRDVRQLLLAVEPRGDRRREAVQIRGRPARNRCPRLRTARRAPSRAAPLFGLRVPSTGAYRGQGAPLSASAADGRASGSIVSRLSMRRLNRRGVARAASGRRE